MSESVDVILLRSADDPDPYVDAFQDVGLKAVCEPVLSFQFPRQHALERRLRARDRYAGLIATSPRAADALDQAFAANENLLDRWQGAVAYTVGPKTAERLQRLGVHSRGMDAGTADQLADRIVEDAPKAPLLFLSGNRRRDELPNRLDAAEIPFEELTVYETHLRTSLVLPGGEGTPLLVFFSPSGLDAVQKSSGVNLTGYRIAAIGPTTAAALEENGISVEAVAGDPSPEGLMAAITSGAG